MTSQFMDPVLKKIGENTSQGPRQELSFELGKMPFYGNRRHCPWA